MWWRSVGHTHTAFATEFFIDMLLEKAGRDPIEGRLGPLDPAAREAGVLEAVANLAGWRGREIGNKGYGVAVHKSFNTYVAQIAEVMRGEDGNPKVTRVWRAVDCGVAIIPTSSARKWRQAASVLDWATRFSPRSTSTTRDACGRPISTATAPCASTKCLRSILIVKSAGGSAHRRRRTRRPADRAGRRQRLARADGYRGGAAAFHAKGRHGVRVFFALAACGAMRCCACPIAAAPTGSGSCRSEILRRHSGSRPAFGRPVRRGGKGDFAPAMRQLPSGRRLAPARGQHASP